jgi:hypothetical protein
VGHLADLRPSGAALGSDSPTILSSGGFDVPAEDNAALLAAVAGTKAGATLLTTAWPARRPGTTPKHRPVASGCAYRRAGKFHPMPPTDSGRADLALAAVTKAGIAVAVELGVGREILVGRIGACPPRTR